MLRLVQLEELGRLAREARSLVDLQTERSPRFVAAVVAWMIAVESALEANRLPAVASVAALRSTILSAERSRGPGESWRASRHARSNATAGAAATALVATVDIVNTEIGLHAERMSEAQALVQQLVAAALSRELTLLTPGESIAHDQLVRLRLDLERHPDFAPAVVRLDGLVGPQDMLILLDRALAVFQHHIEALIPGGG